MGDLKSMQSFIWMLLLVFLIFVPGSTLNAIENTALTATETAAAAAAATTTTAEQQTKKLSTTITTRADVAAAAEIALEAAATAAAATTTTRTSTSLLKDSTSINDTIFLKTYSITQPVATPTVLTKATLTTTTTTPTTVRPKDAHTTTELLATSIPAGSLVRKATNVSISIGTKASLNSSSISRSKEYIGTAAAVTTTATTIVKKSTTAAEAIPVVAVVETAAAPPASAAQTITEEGQVTIAAQLVATLMSIAAAPNNEKILSNDNGGGGDGGDGDGAADVAVSSSVDNKVIYKSNRNSNNNNNNSNITSNHLSRKVINRNISNDNTKPIATTTSSTKLSLAIENNSQHTTRTTNVQPNQHFRPLQKPKFNNEKRNDHQQQQPQQQQQEQQEQHQQQQQQQYMYAHQQYQKQPFQQEQQQPQQYERQFKQQYTRQVQQLHSQLAATATQIPITLPSSSTAPTSQQQPLLSSSTSSKYSDNLWAATIARNNRNLIIIGDKNLKKENVLETEVEKNNLKSIVAAFEAAPATIGTATVAAAAAATTSSFSSIVTLAPAAIPSTTLPPPTIATTTTRRRFIASTTMKPAPAIDDYQTIISQAGTHAYLPCNVKQLVKKPISWLRVRDGHILTVDQTTFIADQRFQSIYASNPERWSLQIKYVQLKDAGTYECQVSTEPKASAIVNLRIVEPKTELIGEPTRHVKAGSQVKLHCIISQALEPPLFINWFYNQKQIYLHNRKGWRTEIERIELPPLPPTTMLATTTATTSATTQPDIMMTTLAAANSASSIETTITTVGGRSATAMGTESIRSAGSVVADTVAIAAAAGAAASMSLSPFNGSSAEIQPLEAEQSGAGETFADIARTTTTSLPIVDVRQITTASLIIPAVEKLDSGNYTCIPSNSAPKTVVLHVLNGEYSASAITSGVNGNMIIGSNSRNSNNNKRRYLLPWQQLHTATTILTLLWIIEFVLVEKSIWNFRRRQSVAVENNNEKSSGIDSSINSISSIGNARNCNNRNNRIVVQMMATPFSSRCSCSTSNSNSNKTNENVRSSSSNSISNRISNIDCLISTTQIAEKT